PSTRVAQGQDGCACKLAEPSKRRWGRDLHTNGTLWREHGRINTTYPQNGNTNPSSQSSTPESRYHVTPAAGTIEDPGCLSVFRGISDGFSPYVNHSQSLYDERRGERRGWPAW